MLYRREAFEPVTDSAWSDARALDGIREIVADTDAALRGPKLLWPADAWDSWQATRPMKNLYVGAAGVLYALDELRRRGHADTRLDLVDLAGRTLEAFRARPDYMKFDTAELRASSLLCGEAGVLLVAQRLAPQAEYADDLLALVRANVTNDTEEVMWGTPGTLLVAHAMLVSSGEERWREACHESAEALWSRRGADGLWVQRLYDGEHRYLGPVHGLVGNVLALAPHLGEERRATLEHDTAGLLEREAVVEDGLANWPPGAAGNLVPRDGEIRLQWCHGAPGVVASSYLAQELVVAGAELCWQAGAHRDEKGPGICHGTAGNGYALLKAFERTGDERWLDRARRFAVHALEQAARLRRARGGGRYSLWTGDLGVALYATDCLDARSRYPFFDEALR